MKLLNRGLALAVVGAGLMAFPTIGAQAEPATAAGDNGVSAMTNEAQGSVAVSKEGATNKVGFIRVKGNGDLMPGRQAGTRDAAISKADAYLAKYAPNFGARAGELEQAGVDTSDAGWTVTYNQVYRGLPVFGSMIRAHVDKQGDLTSVNGYAAPALTLDTTASLSADEAAARAVATVREERPGTDGKADVTGIRAGSNELAVYRLGSTRGETGKAILTYVVEVTNEKNVRDMVFVDADTGKVVNRYSMMHEALNRRLYEADSERNLTLVWKEGDPLLPDPAATVNEDQDSMVKSTGETYWMYRNAFGRDSFNGAGATMYTINNDPAISCPNANWNGVTTNYCDGVSSDDVVSHEWGHAYTEYTSGLIYQWQSGALNESYSDIWGETLDLINGRLDDDEGNLTAKRTVGACSDYTRGDITMTINAPAAIAGPCADAAPASFGPVFPAAGVTSDVVVATDADEDGAGTAATTLDGCSAFTNAAAVNGKWAYVDRGACTFATKANNAKAAGATGLVVGDIVAGRLPISMSGNADIYGVMVRKEDGDKIKAATATVNVTVKDAGTTVKEDSYRWLMGEDSDAFGGAIRDMWTPTCYGDPGKVSDAEYHCDTSDAGGVHSNSGVPNHAFALLTDGGTFNGQTIQGIGIDKAASIHWRAQSAYLTPTSDFTDHANALEASCTDLVGQPLTELTTVPNATPKQIDPLTTADCAEVAKVAAAVELRQEPVQCNFQPMFDKDTPAICGAGFKENKVWSEDFEDGLAGWTASQEIVFDGGFGMPWEATTSAPGGRAGGVAYGPAPDLGDCQGGDNDFSSRDSITSPMVELPDSAQKFPRLSFDQYVATEAGYDGGNVKMSVNGGAFEVIPAEAYLFNEPTTLTGPATNTNPMAAEDGFTGTDGGELTGSWGTSQVDLVAAGAEPGDYVQFRFDIGRDGCGGLDGWYVDNVSVSTCKTAVKVTAVHTPEPSTEGTASAVKVTVQRDGTQGTAPTGDVVLRTKAGDKVGEASLQDGVAVVELPATFPAGTSVLKATYVGTESFASESTDVTVTVKDVAKSDSTTTAKIKPKKPGFRENFKAIVKVQAADGSTPTGKVVVRIDGKLVGKGTLKDGRFVLKVKKDLRPGRHKLVAKYKGSDTVEPSRDVLRFRVVR